MRTNPHNPFRRARAKSLPFAIVGLALATLLTTAAPASAKQCHIRVSASGRFQGQVIDQGGGPYTRFAVKVEYDLSNVSLRYDFDNRTLRECPRTPGEVEISADSSINPLMFHFMNELAGSARADSVSHRFQEVNATTIEFQRATRKLQLGGLGRAWIEIGITVGWDAFQAVVPLGFTTKLAIDFVVETVKEIVKGGGGEGLTKWLLWKIPSLVSELGLSSDEAKALATALENEAKGLDRELADKLKPITITQSGTAGDCQIQYSATLDLKNNRYHVNFDKYCGERGPDVPTATVTTVSVNPGDAAALTAQAVNYLGTAYPLTGATVTGLAAVMADGSAEPAAVIVGGTATFNFTAAKPRKDGDYPVTVNLTTFDGKTARWDGKVTVNNVGPTVSSVDPSEVKADPGETMSIQNATVTVIDDNADKNNPDEVKARDLKLGPHPADLEMSRNNAFGDVDGTPLKSFDPSSGTYVLTFNRNGGRVQKPQMHKTVSANVTITDNNGVSANGSVTLKVNDVEPKVTNIKLSPQFVHRSTPPATITLSGRVSDDNGADDIDRPESYADVSKASSGGVAKLVLGRELTIKGAPGEDHIDFEGTFPQTNDIGAHKIDIFGQDKSGGGHPDGPHKGTDDITLHVGNAKPVINPWGYIYDTELGGIPEPDQQGDGLCPGQPFLAGAIVKDPENDALLVWATIKETGVRANLSLAPGEKTYKGTLNAPGVPGDYTLLFDAKEKDLTEVADTKSSPLTVIPCANDYVDDLSWASLVDPNSLCPADPFTAEGFVTYFLKNKTQMKVYPAGTITFQGASQNVGPAQTKAGFVAPGTPGVYPVSIVINIGGTSQNMTPQVTVEPCGLASGGDLVDPGGDELVSAGFDILSNPELLNPISGSRDASVQLMIIDIVGDPTQPIVLLGQAPEPRRRPFFVDLLHAVGQSLPLGAYRQPEAGALLYAAAGIGGTRGGTTPWRASTRRSSSQTGRGSTPNVSAFITSLGTSYGEAFEMKLLNHSGAPVNLVGKGIVVEPLKKKAQKELKKQLDKQVKRLGKNPVTVKLDAYCLEFVRQPPSPGAVFRIASQELQQKFQPMRHVLTASQRLQELGALTPDTEATEYFHSIRQWAIWSKEQGFLDASAFGKAFVEKTKSNFDAAGRPWTGEIEQIVQGLVPNRWKDIDSVLRGAATLAERDGGR